MQSQQQPASLRPFALSGIGSETGAPSQGFGQSDNSIGNSGDGSGSGSGSDGGTGVWSTAPSFSLPKAGGSLRGLGESFNVNANTGTASFSLSLPITGSRFSPSLTLTYNTGNGNGIFGHGFDLPLPAIIRKTDRGIPRYQDESEPESDVFVLLGAEDLVPVLELSGKEWRRPAPERRPVGQTTYQVRRYRPRIDNAYARIEKWTNMATGVGHWRSISKDNITTLYGTSEESRTADPHDPTRVFCWMVTATYDAKGNACVYNYKREDSSSLSSGQHEANRTPDGRGNFSYIKSIKYGNVVSRLVDAEIFSRERKWFFEVVFDYGDHDPIDPTPQSTRKWPPRPDPLSSYRSGFEIRKYRRCQRLLMFHHFPAEPLVDDNCLVSSIDFAYRPPLPGTGMASGSFIAQLSYTGYRRRETPSGSYVEASLPPIEFRYSEPQVGMEVQGIFAESLQNLPTGLGAGYRWLDLDGEGISGILAEQSTGWYYKHNLGGANFSPTQLVGAKPAGARLEGSGQMFLDLNSDGIAEVVDFQGLNPGYFGREPVENGFGPFRPFKKFPNINFNDRNTQIIDLTGDGNPDILITEEEVFSFYQSLGTDGFQSVQYWRKPLDEEAGPRLVLADSSQSVFLTDMSGDGLADLVRLRATEVCYWPNLGYGKYGAKITMDNSPIMDDNELFHGRRVRLADIDGSGTSDIVYLGSDGKVRIYFNASGNAWTDGKELHQLPTVDDLTSVQVVDLLGNGTACLVWSSSLPNQSTHMQYIDLMGQQKPHLLLSIRDNRGSETTFQYSSSAKHYLRDKLEGKPWVTRLPFPVPVVELVRVSDHITGNKIESLYRYHHGHFEGVEREFRGFGMVEQWDTEQIEAGVRLPEEASDASQPLYVPPSHTKTWYHTGAYVGGREISTHLAQEYHGHGNPEFLQTLLEDTVLPEDLETEELQEACRALKGSMLRQEVYADDASELQDLPYSVSERNYTVELLQPLFDHQHASFHVHARETIEYRYERNLSDPRIQHQLVLKVDPFGNTRKSVAIGYGRQSGLSPPPNLDHDTEQEQHIVTYTENIFTEPILDEPDDYLTPRPSESLTYEFTGLHYEQDHGRFRFEDFAQREFAAINELVEIPYETENIDNALKQKRLVERVRTRYLSDDLSDLLPLGIAEPRVLPGEDYRLAFTPGLISQIYRRLLGNQSFESLIPVPADILSGEGEGHGGYRDLDDDGHWWIPSGRIFYATTDPPSDQELADAQKDFFLPKRFRGPFGQSVTIKYDDYRLLPVTRTDPLQNVTKAENDYRVLQTKLLTDVNGNRSAVIFDALGVVVGTALMGRAGGDEGDDFLNDFHAELSVREVSTFFADPKGATIANLLKNATTRVVYDPWRYLNTAGELPVYSALIEREVHTRRPPAAGTLKWRVKFTYFDGSHREIQHKIETTPGPLVEHGPVVESRWIATGWTVFNNKGAPVRQYEPFFDGDHQFHSNHRVGVGSLKFYDPLGRVIAILHPNHTYDKVVFGPWQQKDYDANDTVSDHDARSDADVAHLLARIPPLEYLPSWYDNAQGTPEGSAAAKALEHADTSTVKHYDALGRPFLIVQDNGTDGQYATRTLLDVEGNQREVFDARGFLAMRYKYDMLGHRIYKASLDAGSAWTLPDVLGRTLLEWDNKGRRFRSGYDELRRLSRSYVRDNAAGPELLVCHIVYGETLVDSSVNPAFAQGPQTPEENCLRGSVWRTFDQAGITTNEAYNFQGGLLRVKRQLPIEYKTTLDWGVNVALAPANDFTTDMKYDALNRLVEKTMHDATVVRFSYNETRLLDKIDVNIQGEQFAGSPLRKGIINKIEYDTRLRRSNVEYTNRTVQKRFYDRLHFRLSQLQILRGAQVLQDLNYVYDPVGNIITITDNAQQDIFFRGLRTQPKIEYTYDAIYRIKNSTGREHLATAAADLYDNYHSRLPHPGDPNALGHFTEQYSYDSVDNLQTMKHDSHDSLTRGWTRKYTYDEESLLEPGIASIRSNRLSSTTVGRMTDHYAYDKHGNCTLMPHLPELQYNYRDQLTATVRQRVNGDTVPETTYYQYDSKGQRVRKITETSAAEGSTPVRSKERIYLDGLEIYREFEVNALNAVRLERQTVDIIHDQSPVVLIENRTIGTQGSLPSRLIRYNLSDHLGSVSLELDGDGGIISYEEYTAFGATAYQAVRDVTEAPKYYRLIGKERDEENGLYYCGERYLAPWLGRWIVCDPGGLIDGPSMYVYAQNRPTVLVDRTGKQGAPAPALSGKNYQKDKNTPEFMKLEASVGALTDPGGTQIRTPKEKSERFFDERTEQHFENVKQVINQSLQIATEVYTDKATGKITGTQQDIYRFALQHLIIPLREKDIANSQNLIYRDTDHYFAGRLQEWQLELPGSRSATDTPSYFWGLLLSSTATLAYDTKKMIGWTLQSSNDPTAGSREEHSKLPASPAGGEEFADLGQRHFFKDHDKMTEKSAPPPVTETFKQEQEYFELQLQIAMMTNRMRMW